MFLTKIYISISVLFCEIVTFMSKNKSFLWISPKMLEKTERHSLVRCGSLFGKKQLLLLFIPFYLFHQKRCLNKSNFSSGFALFKHGRKNKLSEYFSVRFWDSHFFGIKREVLCEFSQKYFKRTERHSLTVCGRYWGEKHFLLIFFPFYWFNQKELLKQIQIFLRISPFSNMVRKTNFLSFSMLICEIVTFMSLNKSLLWISPKMLHNNRKV